MPITKDDFKSLPLLEWEKNWDRRQTASVTPRRKKRLIQYEPNVIEEKRTKFFLKFLTYFWAHILWMIEALCSMSMCATE
jgi:hypothetical protein